MERKNLLDDVFNTSEEEVETFVDALKDLVEDPNNPNLSRLVRGTPDKIQAPELTHQQSGFILIQHGWHDEDYVWHIAPYHPKKPWKVSTDRVIYAIAKAMNDVIPNDITVKIWKPFDDWDIKEITFKAIGLGGAWNVTDQDLRDLNLKLLEVLNTLV